MAGTIGRAGVWKDHHFEAFAALETLAASGQDTPLSTHFDSSPTSSADSFLPGGIISLPVCPTACMSRLAEAEPGSTAGPRLPPLSRLSFESNRKPDMATLPL